MFETGVSQVFTFGKIQFLYNFYSFKYMLMANENSPFACKNHKTQAIFKNKRVLSKTENRLLFLQKEINAYDFQNL